MTKDTLHIPFRVDELAALEEDLNEDPEGPPIDRRRVRRLAELAGHLIATQYTPVEEMRAWTALPGAGARRRPNRRSTA